MTIKHLLLCLFLLVPITAQAEITEGHPPGWIIKCWNPTDEYRMILMTFKHYTDDSPSFASENWIRIWEGQTNQWTWIFSLGANLVCRLEKVLE